MLRPVFPLLLCRLSLAMVPLLATAVADEAIELPSNLSPALRQRLLAQNNVAQPEGVPAPAAPAAPTPEVTAVPTPEVTAVPVPAPPAPVVPAAPSAPETAPSAARRPNITLPTRAGTPRPSGPGAPATIASAEPRPAPPDDPNTFLLAFTGNPIEEVLEEYQRISGRHVIRDVGLTGTVVVVQNPDVKMTKDEGVDFIKASLLIQGFSLQDYMKGIDKCIAITGKPPGLEGPIGGSPIYMSAKDLPETDEPVNYLIRLNYLSAADASQVFANAVPNHTWGAYVAVPSANAILVRGSIPNIRTLIKIKDEVDVEPVAQVHEFVRLLPPLWEAITPTRAASSLSSLGGLALPPESCPMGNQ